MKRIVGCGLAVLLAGCGPSGGEFFCESSAMCRANGRQGTCEVDRHCSFPDDSCSYQRRWVHHSGAVSDQCFGAMPLKANGTTLIGSTWFGQEQPYYDAPAAVRIAISSRRADPPSQATLAQDMGTNTSGTLGTNPVSSALNRYLSPPDYGTVAIMGEPTAAERDAVRAAALSNINAGYPMVCTVESGFRPPGYPAGKIIHYVTVIGHRGGGDEVLIADPGASGTRGAGWEDVARSYWIATSDLATWIGGWGYATRM
jgi:hypothetical protein